MKNVKKVMSMFLAAALVVTMLPSDVVQAAEMKEQEMVIAEERVEVPESRAEGDTGEENGFRYRELKDGTVVITGYTGEGGEVIIPSEINGKKVTSIGEEAFYYCNTLESVIMPEGLTNVGHSVFKGCSNLRTINIPNSLTEIKYEMFYGCERLQNITLPQGVTRIGGRAFYGCSGLEDIIIPDGVTDIEYQAFDDCEMLENIVIPESVTTIGENIFRNTKWMEKERQKNPLVIVNGLLIDGKTCEGELVIPGNVKYIPEKTFWGCTKLRKVTIEEGVTSLEYATFRDCSNLESVVLPEGMTSIADYVFYDCVKLGEIIIPDSVTHFEGCAFENTKWIENQRERNPLVVVNNILINGMACSGVVAVPENVKVIGETAFYDCDSLEEITIPGTVTDIERQAFSYCSMLTKVTLNEGVTSIRIGAFSDCDVLTSVTIPRSVTDIDRYGGSAVFQNSDNVVIYCYNNTEAEDYARNKNISYKLMRDISADTVSGSMTLGIKYPVELDEGNSIIYSFTPEESGNYTFEMKGTYGYYGTLLDGKGVELISSGIVSSFLIRYDLTGGNTYYLELNARYEALESSVSVVKSPLYIYEELDNGTIYISRYNGRDAELVIPSEIDGKMVKGIRNRAFKGLESLKSVIIPEGVTYIEYSAFESCSSLTSIVIPESIKEIAKSAFKDCSQLENVELQGELIYAGEEIFEGTPWLTRMRKTSPLVIANNVLLDARTATGIVEIPSTVTVIAQKAFYQSPVSEVTVPEGFTVIESYTFADSEISAVTLPNSLIRIESNAFLGCRKLHQIAIPGSVIEIGGHSLGYLGYVEDEWDSDDDYYEKQSGFTIIGYPESVAQDYAENNEFNFTANDKEITGISVSELPSKTVYGLYDRFHDEGLIINIEFDDGSVVKRFSGWTLSKPDMSTEGNKTVTVTYKTYTTSFRVTVDKTVAALPESPHREVCEDTWIVYLEGAKNLAITFSEDTNLYSEYYGDYICIYDGNGNEIGWYEEDDLRGETVIVPGDTAEIELSMNGYKDEDGWVDAAYGFKVVKVEAVDDTESTTPTITSIKVDNTTSPYTTNYGTTFLPVEGGLNWWGLYAWPLKVTYSDGSTQTILSSDESDKRDSYGNQFTMIGEKPMYDSEYCLLTTGYYPVTITVGERSFQDTVYIWPVGLEISTSAISMKQGATSELRAWLTPECYIDKENVIAWSSSNPSVVKVEKLDEYDHPTKTSVAKLTAVSSGTAEITATAYNGKKIVCTVTVPGETKECTHSAITVKDTKQATTAKSGYTGDKVCSECGKLLEKGKEIYALKTITLAKSSVTYTGKLQKPSVTIKDSKGNKIDNKNYIVTYKNNKNVGTATATITFKGNYTGKVTKTFKILPKSTALSKVTAKKKGFTAQWKKQASQTTGYEIQYSTKKNFKGAKTADIKKNKTTSKTVSKLTAKKKYYVRIRTYKTVKVNGKSTKIYSGWSKAKTVTTKN